ncbi:hypothetical protein SBV1_3390003 [Verrucomicrobia bacterium]|nr:hypothetical protein SBV1_3390003 [Verrucomicrobiota bacterium]
MSREYSERCKAPCRSPSLALDLKAQNLARLTLGEHLERSATDLAIRGEALHLYTCVNHQVESLPTKRAVDALGNFHNPSCELV